MEASAGTSTASSRPSQPGSSEVGAAGSIIESLSVTFSASGGGGGGGGGGGVSGARPPAGSAGGRGRPPRGLGEGGGGPPPPLASFLRVDFLRAAGFTPAVRQHKRALPCQ